MLVAVASATQAQQTVTRCTYEFGTYVCRSDAPARRPLDYLEQSQRVLEAGRQGQDDAQRRWDQIQGTINARRAQKQEAEQAQRDADANFIAAENARNATEARAKAEAQTSSVDDRLSLERQKLEAIDIVKRYIAAGHCDDARRVAYEFFGTKGAQDATELCPPKPVS